MNLVLHNPRYRRLWMTPRNLREIPVYKLKQALHTFISIDRKYGWTGKQRQQDRFIHELNQIGFKRSASGNTAGYHPNPGGARTYQAQLRNLGLIYPTGSEPEYEVTIAGQEILSGTNPLDTIHHNLLSNQYPSDYSNGQNVRIHPDIKIKPFLFLAKLCRDKDLNGVTEVEMMYACIYGHNWSCCKIVKEKILSFRNNNDFLQQIDNPAEDLFSPKAQKTDIKSRLKDIGHIANTFKNYLESNYLLIKQEDKRYTFNDEHISVYNTHYNEHDRFIEYTNSINFQRTYGSWNKIKDTRTVPSKDNVDVKNFARDRAAEFTAQYFSNNLVSGYPEALDKTLYEMGFSRLIVDEVIGNAMKDSMDYFSAHFLELSVSPKEHRAFELALNDLINGAGISSKHTGQLKVPGVVGGCADVLSFSDMRKESVQFDTKAKKDSNYSLPAGDYRALKSYYEGHNTMLETLSLSSALICCAQVVVSSGFSSNAEKTFKTLSKEIDNPVSGITAHQILRFLKKIKDSNSIEQKNIIFFQQLSETIGLFSNT